MTAMTKTERTPSEQYVLAMGTGVNLGNTFDAFDRIDFSEIDDETAWGNPEVTSDYMVKLKAKGFDSIRIPMTAFTRIDENDHVKEVYLARYEKVVNYALDAGFYVMINLHHDSGEWLINWDGDKTAWQYKRFVSLWTQLADRFKDYGDKLMFESMNEIFFNNQTDERNNELVWDINQAFYDIVRASGGNNATRILVIPTVYTNHQYIFSNYTTEKILGLNDPNIIATVHYYVVSFSAYTFNIGVPTFDEEYRGMTGRGEVADDFYAVLRDTFVANHIGVVVGEYGLLNMGAPGILEDGEVVKFIEFMNYKARELGICTMLWEKGVIINRETGEYYDEIWGNVIGSSMHSRSSYSSGLDRLFVRTRTPGDISIALTLNGNSFQGIYNGETPLAEGTDYEYADGVVTLKGGYLSSLITDGYGEKADLLFRFSAGSDWHQYLNYVADAVFEPVDTTIREDDGYLATYDTDGTPTYPAFLIPAEYNGQVIRRISSLNSEGVPTSANTYASDYMQYGPEFTPVAGDKVLAMMNWYNNAIPDGTYTLVIDFFDGSQVKYRYTRTNGTVTGAVLEEASANA